MESALIHFHGFVGTQLDIIAMHLCSKPSGSEEILLPASYYEYCTYRLIHRWRLLGSEESEHMIKWRPTKTMSGVEAESMVGASTMAVIHLVLVAMQCLNNDSDSTNKIDFVCERIISNFELTVIQNSPAASQNRCWSMLTLLDLQRETSKIMSSVQSGTPYSEKVSCCVAPLEIKLSQST